MRVCSRYVRRVEVSVCVFVLVMCVGIEVFVCVFVLVVCVSAAALSLGDGTGHINKNKQQTSTKEAMRRLAWAGSTSVLYFC